MASVDICVLVGRDNSNLNRLFKSLKESIDQDYGLILVYDQNYVTSKIKGHEFFGTRCTLIPYKGFSKQPEMRNLALSTSQSDYIWFVDDDVSFDINTIKKARSFLGRCYTHNNIGCVAGAIDEPRNYDPSKLPFPIGLHKFKGTIGYFDAALADFSPKIYNFICIHGVGYPIIAFPQGTNMIFCRKALKSIKGFNESLGIGYATYEDSEPSMALSKAGFVTIYNPELRITHHKLPRVSGVDRSNENIHYNLTVIRNHAVSLICNRYPTWIKSIYYTILFSFYHSIRISRDRKLVYPYILLRGIWAVLSGTAIALSGRK